jgi:hypothetical protein
MAKFRKKPVVIEAMQLKRDTLQADHARVLGLVRETVEFFESNFENAGLELCGLMGGKETTYTGQRLNELIEQLAASLPACQRSQRKGVGVVNKIHILKCRPEFFRAVQSGEKTFEIRLNDRGYQIGDVLILSEYDPATARYSGEHVSRRVTYLTSAYQAEGYVVMSLIPAEGETRA